MWLISLKLVTSNQICMKYNKSTIRGQIKRKDIHKAELIRKSECEPQE